MESRGLTVGRTDRLRLLRWAVRFQVTKRLLSCGLAVFIGKAACTPTISETLLYIGDNQIELARDSRVSCRNKDDRDPAEETKATGFSRKNNGV